MTAKKCRVPTTDLVGCPDCRQRRPGALPVLQAMNDYGIGAAIAELARGGLVAQAADLPLETRRSADLTRNIAAFARGGLVENDVPVGSLFARGGLMETFPAVESFPFIGSFQRGIPFIAKTGRALVHQGEAIVPKSQNQRESRGPMHIEIHQHFALDLRLQIADGVRWQPTVQALRLEADRLPELVDVLERAMMRLSEV